MKKGKTELIETNKLILSDFNPNEMPKVKYEHLKRTIQSRGFMQPLTVANLDNGFYQVIDGHHRLKALKESGETEIDCYVIEGKSPQDIKIDLINMNKTRGEFSPEKYQELVNSLLDDYDSTELKELINLEEDFQGFEEDKPVMEDDFEPPKEAKYKIEKGEIWQLGNHRLMCGDATNRDMVDTLMDRDKADMVFTDPPYGVGYEEKAKRLGNKKYSKISGDESLSEAEIIWKDAFLNIGNNLKEGGSYYVTAPQGGDQMMMMMMMKGSIPCKHELIWVKPSPVFSMGRLDYDYQHEPILYGWKGSHKFIGKGEFTKSIWNIGRDSGKLHPTMKPVELIVNAIRNSSIKENIVLDLFGGSGSTLIACEQLNRTCYMMELDPYYCSVIIERWENHTGKKAEKINES